MPNQKKKTLPNQSTDSLYLDKLTFSEKLLKSPMAYLIGNIRLLILAILALVLAGAFSFATLPREVNPEVEIPLVSVSTVLPGADPLDVEQLITKPIEQELADTPNVDRLSSQSLNSVSVITLEFSSNTNPNQALQDVKDRLDRVTDLPEQAEDPNAAKLDFNDQPVWSVALSSAMDRRSLSEVAKHIEEKLEQTSGIRKVELDGEEERQVVIELDEKAIAEYGITADSISQVISGSNITLPAGSVQVNTTTYQVSVDNEATSVSQLRQLPISVGTGSVKLGEIAQVYETAEDTDILSRLYLADHTQPQAAVQLNIFKTDAATIYEAVDVARAVIEEELKQYPEVEVTSLVDNAQQVEDEFTDLSSNFQSTIFLVFLVLFLFLGLRQASIASLSIPLTFLSAFIIMKLTGFTLNFLSLFSLLLALGLVVDDAIVIVQATASYSKKFSPLQTGLLVFQDFVVPIWTTTITTVWAFVPLLLSSGIVGEFIKSIPVVVSATLLSSTSVAVLINLPLTVVLADLKLPSRLVWFLKFLVFALLGFVWFQIVSGSSLVLTIAILVTWLLLGVLYIFNRKNYHQFFRNQLLRLQTAQHAVSKKFSPQTRRRLPSWIKSNWISDGVIDLAPFTSGYRNILSRFLDSGLRRAMLYVGVATFFFVSVFVFPALGWLKNEYFPKTDQENFYVMIEGPAGWPVEKTLGVLDEVAAMTLEEPEITFAYGQTGALPNLDGSAGGAQGPHLGYMTVRLPKREQRERTSIEISDELRAKFDAYNQAKVTLAELSGGPPAGADLAVNIYGEDLETLERISSDFQDIISDLKHPSLDQPAALNVESSLRQSAGQLTISLKEQELRERGLSAIQVAGWLRTALSGQTATDLTLNNEDLEVIVQLPEQNQELSYLLNLQLPTQFGSYTLAEVATVTLETSPTAIYRQDEQRVVTVSAAANDIPAPELLQLFQEKASTYDLPEGYTWTTGGVNEENQESTNSIIQAMGLAAILILITMVWQLNSFRQAVLVLMVIPLAVAGVFFNFTLFGIPLSFPALIGVLALFGIVVNNSIMLIEKINQNLKMGLSFKDSIIDACATRLEAILFTSLTTAFGLLPITISDPLWRGLGGAIIAGLSVSGLLILFLLPTVMFDIMPDKKKTVNK